MNKSCLNWEAKATHLLQIRFLKFLTIKISILLLINAVLQFLDNRNIVLVQSRNHVSQVV